MARSTVSRGQYLVRYRWPNSQFLIWRFIMYGTAGTILGVNAAFITIQQQLGLGVPWLFPYGVTVGVLSIVFLIILEAMLLQKNLLPGVVMLGGFIMFVLYLAGLIECAIQLFGSANVNGNCNTYINDQPSTGVSVETLAWLEQRMICQAWDAELAFWIVGMLFIVWLVVMASQVYSHGLERQYHRGRPEDGLTVHRHRGWRAFQFY